MSGTPQGAQPWPWSCPGDGWKRAAQLSPPSRAWFSHEGHQCHKSLQGLGLEAADLGAEVGLRAPTSILAAGRVLGHRAHGREPPSGLWLRN